ncbi:hypothetical protein AB7M69_011670 [Bradyrhizobium japonicum]
MRELFDLVGPELNGGNLVGLYAGAFQNCAKECDVGAGPSDDADLVSRQIGDLTDLAACLFLGVLARSRGRRPQDDKVLPQDRQRLRVGRHPEVAAADCQVGFAGAHQGQGFGRSCGRDRREPDRPAFLVEGLGHRLDHLVVFAA